MKNKKIILPLLTALLFTSCDFNGGTPTSSNDNQTSDSLSEVVGSTSSNEEVNSNFPFDEIKTFFNTDIVPPSFEGEEIFIEKSEVNNAQYVTVYTVKNDKASNDYFNTYLKTLGYDDPIYVNNDTEGEYYYVNSTSSLPYQVVYYEETIDDVTYFIVQYSFGDSYSEDYITTTTFPDAEIKSYLGVTESLVSFVSSEYYYAESYDSLGYTCFYMFITDGSMNADSYYTLLSNASYIIEEYEDETGPYYDAYNEDTGYELLFWDDSSENSFNLQIYSLDELYGDSGDDSGDYDDYEYTTTTTFPDAEIKSYLGTTNSIVSFVSSEYYYAETEDYYGYTCFYMFITDGSMNADSYYTLLSNASYTIEPVYYEDSTELSHYDAYNEDTGYEVLFWDNTEYNSFDLQIYALDDSTIDDGNDDNTQDEIKLVDTLFVADKYCEESLTVNGITFEYNNIMKSPNYAGTFQFKKNAGTMHNTTPLSGTTTLVIDLNYCYTTPSITVCGGTTADTCNTVITPTVDGNTYTYDITSYSYISISNTGGNAFYLNSITIK